MQIKRIKQDDLDIQKYYIEGNRDIGSFYGYDTIKMFEPTTFWLSENYHESWDKLIPVIQKIKHMVANDTNLFESINAIKKYKDICYACYDCDIQQAYTSVLNWIYFYQKKEIKAEIKIKKAVKLTVDDYKEAKSQPMTMDEILFMNGLKQITKKKLELIDTKEVFYSTFDIHNIRHVEAFCIKNNLPFKNWV